MAARRKRSGRQAAREWGRWHRAELSDESRRRIIDAGYEEHLPGPDETIWHNEIYQVHETPIRNADDDRVLVHLSIRRLDRRPIRDWRAFQRIKNDLVGAECEAAELYPAESRLIDGANQYHLWCLPLGVRFPFGFNEGRDVTGSAEAAAIGARQRDPEAGCTHRGWADYDTLVGSGHRVCADCGAPHPDPPMN